MRDVGVRLTGGKGAAITFGDGQFADTKKKKTRGVKGGGAGEKLIPAGE